MPGAPSSRRRRRKAYYRCRGVSASRSRQDRPCFCRRHRGKTDNDDMEVVTRRLKIRGQFNVQYIFRRARTGSRCSCRWKEGGSASRGFVQGIEKRRRRFIPCQDPRRPGLQGGGDEGGSHRPCKPSGMALGGTLAPGGRARTSARSPLQSSRSVERNVRGLKNKAVKIKSKI